MSYCVRHSVCPSWVAMGLAVAVTGYTLIMKRGDKNKSRKSLPTGLRKRCGTFVGVPICILCM